MYNRCQVETMWSQMPCPEFLPLLQCSLWKLIIDNLLLTKLPQTRSTQYHPAIMCLKLEDVPFQDFTLLCGISTGYIRPIAAREWRRHIFYTIHRNSHVGNHPTLRAISHRFVWHKMKADVRNWCRTCHSCQSSKTQRHVHAPLQSRTLPDRSF